jgi:hypothetical protein
MHQQPWLEPGYQQRQTIEFLQIAALRASRRELASAMRPNLRPPRIVIDPAGEVLIMQE